MASECEKLISIKEMCLLLHKDRRTIWGWVRDRKFPQPLKIGNRTMGWRQAQYEEWLEKNTPSSY